MERKELINIADDLQDVTALVAFLQQVAIDSLEQPLSEQSKNGLYVFVTEILDRLNLIQKCLSIKEKE